MRGRRRLRKWREEPRYNLLALKQMIDRWYEVKMPLRNSWSFFNQSNAVTSHVSDGREWFHTPVPHPDITAASSEAAISAFRCEHGRPIEIYDNRPRVIISRYPVEITQAILESVDARVATN
jgi:hypothetical protein